MLHYFEFSDNWQHIMMIHATKTLLLCTPVIISLMLYRNFLENTGRQIMCSEYKKTTQNTKWNDLIAQRKARILKRKWLSQKGNEQCFYLWWVVKRRLREMRMDFCFFVLCFNNTISMTRVCVASGVYGHCIDIQAIFVIWVEPWGVCTSHTSWAAVPVIMPMMKTT